MKCAKCGAELEANVLFCRECGAKVAPQKKRFCRECGAALSDGTRFCTECGSKLEILVESVEEASSPSDSREDTPFDSKWSNSGDRSPASAFRFEEKVDELKEKASAAAKQLKVVQQKGKHSLLIIVAVLLLIAVIVSLGSRTSSRKNSTRSIAASGDGISVIDVVNMPYAEAKRALLSAGFTNVTANVDSNTDESLWFVVEQSVNAGTYIRSGDRIELTCALKCRLYIDIRSETNLFFSTYDITVTLDGTEIGSIPNGKSFSYLADVFSGDHTLEFCKAGSTSPKCTKRITVSGDMTYSCDLGHGSASIDIKNEKKDNSVAGATLEVAAVTGMVLSEAMDTLKGIGFANLREEPYGSIWDKSNWIVTEQSITAGTVTDKNAYIQLDCISLDDYFSNIYVGKNLNEIQELAAASGFSLRYEDTSWNDLNSEVSSMDATAKSDWVVIKARQYKGADKTATVTIKNTGEVVVPTATPTPTASSAESLTDYHSSHDRDVAKKGNSGIYSYRNRGTSYYVYYIIDFDEGYVYYFCDGNGDETCDRVKMVSGDLNSVLIITYHDGNAIWSEGLHFKWQNQPDHLIVEDNDHFEWDFYTTELDKALAILDKKTIHDY